MMPAPERSALRDMFAARAMQASITSLVASEREPRVRFDTTFDNDERLAIAHKAYQFADPCSKSGAKSPTTETTRFPLGC